MRELEYKAFSFRTHKKNWQMNRLNVCQFELTFGCGLHCKHCYADCYNKLPYIRKELDTKQVKLILDKVHKAGMIWLCFTGGDPLTRPDFLEVYSFAKDKGFIITVFTNGYSMTRRIADYLKEKPPFVIEVTLNAVTGKIYEDISRVKGSYDKMMAGLKMIAERKLSLDIKTQAMQNNLEELPKIKEFIESLGLKFRPSFDLHSRLNGDLTSCDFRISPDDYLRLNKRFSLDPAEKGKKPDTNLFRCAAGDRDGIHIDPYGNIFLCNLIRKPSFNLLNMGIEDALNRLSFLVKDRRFTTDSKCKNCKIREFCRNCPGRALLETGDKEAVVPYYCELAHLTLGYPSHKEELEAVL